MEEGEEARTAVDAATVTAADEATVITADEAEAEDIITLARAAQLRKDCAMLSAPACLTRVRSRPQTKQEHHERNLCNMSALTTAKI